MALLVIGLGNPGDRYAETRHNAGFAVVDQIAERMGARLKKPPFKRFEFARVRTEGHAIYLAKPLTFMNNSGGVLKPLLGYTGCELSDILVVCDTLDLPVGICRLKERGSSAGQKGLASILSAAGTQEISRLYIGIGRPEFRRDVVGYVLEEPTGKEREALENGIASATHGILRLASDPPVEVMNELNRTGDPP